MTKLCDILTEEVLRKALVEDKKSFVDIAREYSCSDTSVTRIAKRFGLTSSKKRLVNEEFFLQETADLFYILGLFATDGFISVDDRIGIELVDEDVITWISKTIRYTGTVVSRTRDKGQTTYTIKFTSPKVASIFKNYGITPKKTQTLDIRNVPFEFYGDFLRGVFEGDGCISYGKRAHRKNSYFCHFSVATASELFAVTVREMFTECCGVTPSVVCEKLPTGHTLYKICVTNLRGVHEIAKNLYGTDAFGMERKKTKMLSVSSEFLRRSAA